MMNILMNIPAEFGWAMVGFMSAMLVVATYNIGKCVVEAIKMRIEDAKEEEECEE